MKSLFAKHPRISFWAVVAVSVAISWIARATFIHNGVWNQGVAFSFRLPLGFIYFLSSLILAALIYWQLTIPKANWVRSLGVGLIVGGGIANLLDRLLNYGQVWDYIPFLRIGHFNLADILVSCGLATLLYYWWKEDAR